MNSLSTRVDPTVELPVSNRGPALIEVNALSVHFPVKKGLIFEKVVGNLKAVDGVSFSIGRGEVFGLVGESGCGKTTLARTILKLEEPTAGQILFDGRNIATLRGRDLLAFRRSVQAVFQDPFSSLNPRMLAGDIIGEPMYVHNVASGSTLRSEVSRLLDICGLPAQFADRYPHEMSGGQRQRVGIARALALNPRLIVCDEAVSALDVSIQAQIINLLEQLRHEFGLAFLFIGHDLSIIRHICDRVGVMYLGKITELAASESLFSQPLHPYTRALIDAVPVPDPRIEAKRNVNPITGEPPSPLAPPTGCVFNPRCRSKIACCTEDVPILEERYLGHSVACWVSEQDFVSETPP